MSLIIILISMYILTQKNCFRNLFCVLLMLNLYNVNIGCVAVLGGIEITYIDFMTIVVAFACLVSMKYSLAIDRHATFILVLLLLSIFIGIFMLGFAPSSASVLSYAGNWDSYFRGNVSMLAPPVFSMQSILQLVRLIVFVFIILIVKREISSKDWEFIIDRLVRSTWVMLPLFLFELITVSIGSDLFTNTRNILFNFWYIDMENRLCGLSTEPSYYAITIFLIIAMNMLYLKNKEISISESNFIKVVIVLYYVIGFSSGAFSFYLAVVALGFLFLKEKLSSVNQIIISMSILILIGLILLNYREYTSILLNSDNLALNRLGNTFNTILLFSSGSNIAYTSESTRILSIIMTGEAWLTRPLFGLGLGTTICFSGIVSILSTVGIVGLILWYILVFHCYPNKKNSEIYYLIFLLIYLPAGDFELMYGFNVILWIQMIGSLGKNNEIEESFGGVDYEN